MDHSRTRPAYSPGCSQRGYHQGRAPLDPQWPVAQPDLHSHHPSIVQSLKSSLGVAGGESHALSPASSWPVDKHTRPHAWSVWSILHPTTSNICHVRTSIWDTAPRPSVIGSVCAARPPVLLGDAITELNAYTKGGLHICGPGRR